MTLRTEMTQALQQAEATLAEAPSESATELHLCNAVDQILQSAFAPDFQAREDFTLLAIGGYGQGRLHPRSDIDLLFLFRGEVDEAAVNEILGGLWDGPFNLGHQVRTLGDFTEFAADEMESYTAFLDSRRLLGSESLASEFVTATLPRILKDEFVSKLVEMKRNRYQRFGGTVFHLEPDLKDAPGGIRDVQWADWIRRCLAVEDDRHVGPPPTRFHYRVRNLLHLFAKRNHNILTYEYQERVASILGYRDTDHGDAAENLMREYFLNAGEIARVASVYEDLAVRPTDRTSVSFVLSGPFDFVAAFEDAHQQGLRLDAHTLRTIEQRLSVCPDNIATYWPGNAVVRMMRKLDGLYETLLTMHEVGLLGRVFPEFEEIRCRVIRDFFHRYTVDEHSLIAIRNIEDLRRNAGDGSRARLSRLLNDLAHPELVPLALLFHDIGKAHRHDAGNHVHPGVEGVHAVLERLRLSPAQAEQVVFLVQNHLEMSKLVLKRDFTDEAIQRQFADLVGTVENLRMLCLLTWADMCAVNPEVMTSWKEDLLWHLYIETYNRLTLGLADDRYEGQAALEAEILGVSRYLPARCRPEIIRDFLSGFPRQYLRTTPKSLIAEHLLLSEQLESKPMVMHLAVRENYHELLVMTADRPQLFSKIVGVLAYFGGNIIRGEAFANRRGTICDLIAFEDSLNILGKNPSEVERLETLLGQVIEGRLDVDQLLRGKIHSVVFQRSKGVGEPTIHFDDTSSKRCTILEISAPDATGLLYRVSSVLAKHGCNIDVARIATEGHRAIDVFYLTRDGSKLDTQSEQLIRTDLAAEL